MEARFYSQDGGFFYNSNYNTVKNHVNGYDFSIDLTNFDNKQKISVCFFKQPKNSNYYLAETFVDDIKETETFLQQVSELTGIDQTRKLAKMLIQIHKFYGGEYSISKGKYHFELSMDCQKFPKFKYAYDNLQNLIKDVYSLQKRMKMDKLKNAVNVLLDALY